MPRPVRSLEEGRTYHVYNRVGGEGMPFSEEILAARFLEVLRKTVDRDELAVYAWVLMGNHYHLVARMGAAPLSRSMKSLQQKVTRSRNRLKGVFGPMWQGRFKAKEVDRQEYLEQLIAYVHLTPIVAVDDALSIYGRNRRQALRGYRLALRDVCQSEWSEEGPGKLPWWRLGRAAAGENLRPENHVMLDELGRPTSPFRVRFDAETWVEVTCRQFGVERGDLSSRRRHPEIIRVRDLVGLVGVERYGVRVKDLAALLGKSEDGVSLWVRRGARRREEDPAFAAEADDLDNALKEER
jgi:putative transposase